MKKEKNQPEEKKKSTGFRLDKSLVLELKMEALRQGCHPNELLERWIRQMLQKNKTK